MPREGPKEDGGMMENKEKLRNQITEAAGNILSTLEYCKSPEETVSGYQNHSDCFDGAVHNRFSRFCHLRRSLAELDWRLDFRYSSWT